MAVTACVSGTELRSLDPEEGGCFAVHLHLALTGAELAAVSRSLIACNKTDSVHSLPLILRMEKPRCIPGLAMRASKPLSLWFSASQAGWGSQKVSTSRKQGKRTPEGSGGQMLPLAGLSPGLPLIIRRHRQPDFPYLYGQHLGLPPPHPSLAS